MQAVHVGQILFILKEAINALHLISSSGKGPSGHFIIFYLSQRHQRWRFYGFFQAWVSRGYKPPAPVVGVALFQHWQRQPVSDE